MAHKIFDLTCTACHNCKQICPVDEAIIAGDSYRIDDAHCIDCGICVDDCPSASIFRVPVAAAA